MVIYIILGIALIVIIWNYFFSTPFKLQTVNAFTGGLGSLKTYNAAKLGLKMRNRSVRNYFLIGKHPVIFAIVLFFIFLIGILQLKVNILSLALFFINFIILYILISKRESLKKKFKIRKIYAYFPLLIKGSLPLFRKLSYRVEKFEKQLEELKELPNDDPQKKLVKEKYDKAVKIRDKRCVFCEKLTLDMLLGKEEIEEYPIVIIDEASLIFPAQNARSNPEISWNFKLARHFYDPIMILTTQSIGDLDVALRRVLNKVYNLSSKREILWLFYKVDVDIINYMEDVVQNTNNIKEDNKMFNFGFFGPRKYDSRYMRKYYNPKKKKLECKYYDPTLDPCKDVVNKHNEFIRAFYSSSVKKEDFIENDSTVVLEATTYE